MSESAIGRIEINGAPAQIADLRVLAATNYGHFTSMQVRDGCVRGLDLHLDRLQQATRTLFGTELDLAQVRAWMRQGIAPDPRRLSLRVNVFARGFDREHPAAPVQPDVLVAVGAPAQPRPAPLRVKSFAFERTLPEVKHVGTFPLFQHRRMAQLAGFDDALFVDRNGHVSEGSVWNVLFVDGDEIVWPDSPQLRGVAMQLLQAGVERHGMRGSVQPVALADVTRFRYACFTNSSQPVCAISCIDAVEFTVDKDLGARLVACYESNPLVRI